MNADLIIAGVQSGWAWTSKAPIPATCGLDIDVPLIDWNNCPGAPPNGVGVLPARMLTPAAVMSGLMMSRAPPFGPRDEKSAIHGAGIATFSPPKIWPVAAEFALMYALTAR